MSWLTRQKPLHLCPLIMDPLQSKREKGSISFCSPNFTNLFLVGHPPPHPSPCGALLLPLVTLVMARFLSPSLTPMPATPKRDVNTGLFSVSSSPGAHSRTPEPATEAGKTLSGTGLLWGGVTLVLRTCYSPQRSRSHFRTHPNCPAPPLLLYGVALKCKRLLCWDKVNQNNKAQP